ncbi:preprotein translocase subunit SecG [Pelovirga terrestris]|uniref:Protein-export membrane protein SecG n=1 Tax=Pelovirga terrestris TaxID=2771352 RepID=A0A8J6QVV6_9BACT|nr:preprotein translocase subunit SecG [Pelovirga terrestris]MBD1399291.1 preprotein translocase subunit SecG [Pelovirga terrestris]
MISILIGIHILVSIALVVIVLLQMGKGAQAGASFGAGSSQTMFGSSGGNVMTKITATVAVIFMLTSLSLAYYYGSSASKTIMPGTVTAPASSAPIQPTTNATPQQ